MLSKSPFEIGLKIAVQRTRRIDKDYWILGSAIPGSSIIIFVPFQVTKCVVNDIQFYYLYSSVERNKNPPIKDQLKINRMREGQSLIYVSYGVPALQTDQPQTRPCPSIHPVHAERSRRGRNYSGELYFIPNDHRNY